MAYINGNEVYLNAEIERTVNVDYNQNDETAPDYIKNRPFYTSKSVVMPETTKVVAEWYETRQVDFELIEGETYDITINGVKYARVCELFENQYLCLGNFKMFTGIDNGDPFTFGYASGYAAFGMLEIEEDEATIKIEGAITKKLDEEFLSESVVVKQDLYKTLGAEGFISLTQEEYDALVADGNVNENVYYLIKESEVE